MRSCFFSSGSPRRPQALHSGGGGGGVTVILSQGDSQVRAKKIVVSRGELDRIAAGVTRRQQQCGWTAPLRRHIAAAVPPLAVSRGEQQAAVRAPPRLELEERAGAGAARRGDWLPALDGIPEEA